VLALRSSWDFVRFAFLPISCQTNRIGKKYWRAWADPGGAIGAIATPKTYKRNFIHHDFVQIEKHHSRYHAILPSIVLSQQYF